MLYNGDVSRNEPEPERNTMKISTPATQIAEIIEASGAAAWVTGGACRDEIMGIAPRDFDFEAFGADKAEIAEAIQAAGISAKIAGAAYSIIIATIEGEEIEISIATGTMAEAAGRRDITANAIYFRPATGEWFDPFDGRSDIEAGIIRATAGFPDDPARMMRAARFAARFGWTIEPATAEMIRQMASRMSEIAIERIWPEFEKAFAAERPGDFIRSMAEIGIISHFPQIAAMIGCPQDAEWHPEGDAFAHTAHTMDAAARICRRDGITGEDRIAFIAGAMIHDCGKPATTIIREDGRIASPGHAAAGIEIAEAFFAAAGIGTSRIASRAIAMTAEHMAHTGEISPRGIRRIASRIAARGATMTDIARIIEADMAGRPPIAPEMPAGAIRMMEIAEAEAISASAPAPIIIGRHCIAAGMRPGPAIGEMIRAAFEAQIEGEITDEASGMAFIAARI